MFSCKQSLPNSHPVVCVFAEGAFVPFEGEGKWALRREALSVVECAGWRLTLDLLYFLPEKGGFGVERVAAAIR